jgi:hypothetical protein
MTNDKIDADEIVKAKFREILKEVFARPRSKKPRLELRAQKPATPVNDGEQS